MTNWIFFLSFITKLISCSCVWISSWYKSVNCKYSINHYFKDDIFHSIWDNLNLKFSLFKIVKTVLDLFVKIELLFFIIILFCFILYCYQSVPKMIHSTLLHLILPSFHLSLLPSLLHYYLQFLFLLLFVLHSSLVISFSCFSSHVSSQF